MIYAIIFLNSGLGAAYIEGQYQLAIIIMIYAIIFFWNPALCTAYIVSISTTIKQSSCGRNITSQPHIRHLSMDQIASMLYHIIYHIQLAIIIMIYAIIITQ